MLKLVTLFNECDYTMMLKSQYFVLGLIYIYFIVLCVQELKSYVNTFYKVYIQHTDKANTEAQFYAENII